ncbi:hypothetical protein PCASD_26333 [Puccinia coronata f. sp. avenae]|uniref:DNA-directed RNA polymerase n=2 Tax=Puccinia coronata f. sp. avenae TaxID=200324 RepID=A0A2N5RVG3_9BASI|nr:hypothetical protein PCASD_26333 [Puccinia coronata f. sp. avenae]
MRLLHLASIFEPPTAKTWRPTNRSPVNARAGPSSSNNTAFRPSNSHHDYGPTQPHPSLVLPARNMRYKVNTSLSPEELESIQHRSSQWQKSKVAAKDSLCILRSCNRRYHGLRGVQPDKSTPPELATAQIKNQVGFLARCRYVPGHYSDGRVVCLPLRECSGLENLLSSRVASIERMIGGHSAWYDRFFVTYCKTDDGLWRDKSEEVSAQHSNVLCLIEKTHTPLACYTAYASTEERNCRRDTSEEVYTQPEETTAVTGLLGTLHNNTAIDMAPWEPENEPDTAACTYNTAHLGFICAAHMSHSTDAGRVGRLCRDTTVRLCDDSLQDQYTVLQAKALGFKTHRGARGAPANYTVFACGYYCFCTEFEALGLHRSIVEMSEGNSNSMSCHWYRGLRLLVISDVSGVVLRPDALGRYGDSLCFNRAVGGERQTTTHRKTLQAMAPPWAANVSSVCPLRCEWPEVTTPLMGEIKSCHEREGGTELACLPGGRNISICLANLANTYEDCIGVSRRSAEAGLFSHVDICTLSLLPGFDIPPVGSPVTTETHPWWKCEDRCQHTESGLACSCYKSDVRAVVSEVRPENDGSLTVKVVRYAKAVTGNKLATAHGQKGVMYILEDNEMPVGVLDDGTEINFDVVMSLSSVVNRQTLGQYFEMLAHDKQHYTHAVSGSHSLSPLTRRSRGGA